MRTNAAILLIALFFCGSAAASTDPKEVSALASLLDIFLGNKEKVSTPYKVNYDSICSNPGSIEEADLCQQWRSAEYSEWNTLISWLQLVFSIFGSLGAIATVFLSWRALVISQNISQIQLRSYISINDNTIHSFNSTAPCTFSITIINSGHAPATVLSWGWNFSIRSSSGFIPDFSNIDELLDVNTTIIQSGTVIMVSKNIPVSDVDISKLKANSANIYIYGFINFKDTFNDKRIYYFSYKLIVDEENTEKLTSSHKGKFEVRWSFYGHINGEKEDSVAEKVRSNLPKRS